MSQRDYIHEALLQRAKEILTAPRIAPADPERLASAPWIVAHLPEGEFSLAPFIDHTLLKQDATEQAVRTLCDEALRYSFASVCVSPSYVPLSAEFLRDSNVKVCTVIGFPLGATTRAAKVFEAENAIANGAQEIDMVINVGALKSGNLSLVDEELRHVAASARGADILLKVIIETCLLTDEEKIIACLLAQHAGAKFVKTSTGFSTGGATASDIRLMRSTVGINIGVKASGGIRNRDQAVEMLVNGANRIGTSAGVAIVTGASVTAKGY